MVDNGSLSFTSNRGPSSDSKASPTRTTMSSPTHASGMGCPPRGSSLSYSHHVSLPLSPPPCCPLERLSAPLVAGPMQGGSGPGLWAPRRARNWSVREMYRTGAVGVPRITDAGSSVSGNTLLLGISVNRGSPSSRYTSGVRTGSQRQTRRQTL
jgi:hypothetical protein